MTVNLLMLDAATTQKNLQLESIIHTKVLHFILEDIPIFICENTLSTFTNMVISYLLHRFSWHASQLHPKIHS